MPLTALDVERLERALELAHRSIGLCDPNPRVGCVIASAAGDALAEGYTQRAGGAHAEVAALAAARAAGLDVRGGTAWVTLEPCAHHGRTPPCCDALVDAGLARVVVGHVDPYPSVAGAGIARLRAAGIRVDVADDGIAAPMRELNVGFLSRVERGRPWIRLKVAASLDGRTALHNGRSQWITGAEARADGHRWRKRAGAILSGVGTVLADDPRLDVRLVATDVQPLRVVVDSSLRAPPAARVFAPPGRCLVATAAPPSPHADALRARGVEVVALRGDDGRVDLAALAHRLGADGVNELHVEAGSRLNGALLRADLVDELLVYQAPALIGPGRAMADLPTLADLDRACRFRLCDVRRVGADLCLRLRPAGAAD